MGRLEALAVAPQMIDAYLQVLNREGRAEGTIRVICSILQNWYQTLPEEKTLAADALDVWETYLREKAFAERTIQGQVTTVKRFLKYLESPETFSFQKKGRRAIPLEKITSREEYHLLLQTAREMGYRRAYLLIKTIVCLGIRNTEMEYLSVEGLKNGTERIPFRSTTRSVKIFEPLRTELLAYATERGVQEGVVFGKADGLPIQHSLIWKEIKKVCRRVGLPEEKGIPKSLYQLYIQTRAELAKESVEEVDKNYLALLEQEEALVAWN